MWPRASDVLAHQADSGSDADVFRWDSGAGNREGQLADVAHGNAKVVAAFTRPSPESPNLWFYQSDSNAPRCAVATVSGHSVDTRLTAVLSKRCRVTHTCTPEYCLEHFESLCCRP
jgi:hypothetical protein